MVVNMAMKINILSFLFSFSLEICPLSYAITSSQEQVAWFKQRECKEDYTIGHAILSDIFWKPSPAH